MNEQPASSHSHGTIDLAVILRVLVDHRRRDRNRDYPLAALHHDIGKTRSVRTARVWESEGPVPPLVPYNGVGAPCFKCAKTRSRTCRPNFGSSPVTDIRH